jgi:hypothetical protein
MTEGPYEQSMNAFPRGSEWRKWDLHVHAPGTKLNNGYGSPPNWDRFCEELETSDVAAFGITDYFSLDGFFACRDEFSARYPESRKVLFPNLEIRLNESVNRQDESVNLHFLLRPELSEDDGHRLLNELKTEMVGSGGRQLSCADLSTKDQYEQATVTRASVSRRTPRPGPRLRSRVLIDEGRGVQRVTGCSRRSADAPAAESSRAAARPAPMPASAQSKPEAATSTTRAGRIPG